VPVTFFQVYNLFQLGQRKNSVKRGKSQVLRICGQVFGVLKKNLAQTESKLCFDLAEKLAGSEIKLCSN
jgi:hypothetical protein